MTNHYFSIWSSWRYVTASKNYESKHYIIISILQCIDVTILATTVISKTCILRWIKWRQVLQIIPNLLSLPSLPNKPFFGISEYKSYLQTSVFNLSSSDYKQNKHKK